MRVSILGLLAILTSCGEASGKTLDPARDLDCSVVAFYFNGLTQQIDMAADEKRAARVLHEWYAAKLRERAVEAGTADTVLREAEPVLEAIKAAPGEATDELSVCAERALADPAFEPFAATIA